MMHRFSWALAVLVLGVLGGCLRPDGTGRPPERFRRQFLACCDLAASELMKEITPFDPFNRENDDPATHHMPAFEDAHAVRALAVAYDMTADPRYLAACTRWSDWAVRQQQAMIPRGAYYMNHSRAPGQDHGQWNAADSSSVGMGVLATAVRCREPARRQTYLASVRAFAQLVIDNYVREDGGVSNGLWPEYDGSWWCSTANFCNLAFLLYEETREPRYREVGLAGLRWMLRRDYREHRPITFEQRPSGTIFYCFDFYVTAWDHLGAGTEAHRTAVRQAESALEWMAAHQKTRVAGVPDYTEKNVDMAGLPYLMYALARRLPGRQDVVAAADRELAYIGDLLWKDGPPNVSRLKYWEVLTWGMLSYAERLAPGALKRSSRSVPPSRGS